MTGPSVNAERTRMAERLAAMIAREEREGRRLRVHGNVLLALECDAVAILLRVRLNAVTGAPVQEPLPAPR